MKFLKTIAAVLLVCLCMGCKKDKPFSNTNVEKVAEYKFKIYPQDYEDVTAFFTPYKSYEYTLREVVPDTESYIENGIHYYVHHEVNVYSEGEKLENDYRNEMWVSTSHTIDPETEKNVSSHVRFYFPDDSERDVSIEVIRTTYSNSI